MSCACPQKLAKSSARAQQANTEESEDTTVKATGKAKFTTQDLLTAITDLNDEDKDKLIQEAFLGKDF